MTSLESRIAVVTGAGGGVGRGIAIALAAHGANVALLVRRASTADEVAGEIARSWTARSFECDVSDRDHCARRSRVENDSRRIDTLFTIHHGLTSHKEPLVRSTGHL